MWCSRSLIAATLLGYFAAGSALADGAFVLGAGAEVDSEDGLAASIVADFQATENTWLFGALGGTEIDLPRGQTTTNIYAEAGIDHYFNPAGVRLSAAYAGDPDFFDSTSAMLTVYSRGDDGMLGIDLEYSEFNLSVPQIALLPARDVPFSAFGLGMNARLNVSENFDLRFSGVKNEYDVDVRVESNDRIVDLVTFSRLSLIASLADWRAGAGIGWDFGSRRLQLDVSRWQGIADGSTNDSATVRFLTPLTMRTDIELSLGYDDSDLYGEVTFLSVFLYFYGGN